MPLCVNLEKAAPAFTARQCPPCLPGQTQQDLRRDWRIQAKVLIHVCEGCGTVPSVDQAAVFKRAGVNSKIGSHNTFSVAIAVCKADPWLEIAKVRLIHLAYDSKVARRRQEIKVVANPEGKCQVWQHLPLILHIEVGQFMPECDGVSRLARRSIWTVVEAVLPGQAALRNLLLKVGPCLLKRNSTAFRTEMAERPGTKEALRTEDSNAGVKYGV